MIALLVEHGTPRVAFSTLPKAITGLSAATALSSHFHGTIQSTSVKNAAKANKTTA